MEHKKHAILATIFYILGTIAAIYVGAYLMLLRPIYILFLAFMHHELTISLVLHMGIRILLSGTMGGFVWCIGYVFRNHFMGTEDPDWSLLNPKEDELV